MPLIAYLRLNAAEDQHFQRWEERGIEKGREIGRHQGQIAALRAVLLDVLAWKFGPPDEALTSGVAGIDSVERLKELTHLALTAGSPEQLVFSLLTHQPPYA